MSHPTNKAELVQVLRASHKEMTNFLATLSDEDKTAPILDEGWSIKDSLQHLVDWENMMLGWVESSVRGVKPTRYREDFVATGDGDEETMLRLNNALYEQGKMRPLGDVLADFNATHAKVLATLAKVSEADIFDENRFPWRNGSALGNVIAGNTFAHYEEHLGWIRAGLAKAEKG